MTIATNREPHASVLSVRVTQTEYERLAAMAEARGDASIGSLARLAIREFLARQKSESGSRIVDEAAAF